MLSLPIPRWTHGLALLALAIAFTTGCGDGESRDSRETGGREAPADVPAPGTFERPAPAGRVELDRRFPAIPVEPLGHGESLLKAHQWTIAALAPAACEVCAEEVDEWLLQWGLRRVGKARFVIVAEGRPDGLEWLSPVTGDGADAHAFSTTSPMFRHTGELDRPVFALVDTMGVVRFIGRQEGTIGERWTSIFRNLRYQSAPDSTRREIVRRVFPTAARIELRRATEIEGLAEMVPLGLSPWLGVAYRESGDVMGYGLPVERDTECDTCDPLYLIVGTEPRGHVIGIEEIEPVVSLGKREMTGAFFTALRGVGSTEDVARVEQMLVSPKADRAVREILSVTLAAAKRLAAATSGEAGGTATP